MPVYLDNQTATRPFPDVIDKMLPFYQEFWGSISSEHRMGQELFPAVTKSRAKLYSLLGAQEEDGFVLTSSGTEATAQVFLSTYLDFVRVTGRTHLATTPVENSAVHLSIERLEKLGCTGKLLPLNAQGQLTTSALEEALRPRTALVSLSWANGLTGVIQPIVDLAEVCRQKDVRLHVDATHVIGKSFFRFQDLPIDYLSFDGARLHGPKHTAGLFCKQGSALGSLALGKTASSDLDVASLVGLAIAVEMTSFYFDHLCTETARLRDKLEQGIRAGFPDAVIFFQEAERLPHCCAIGFPGIDAELLLFMLNRKGVFATRGGEGKESLFSVLTACHVNPDSARTALSFSLSYETKEEDIDRAIETIVAATHTCRSFSQGLIK